MTTVGVRDPLVVGLGSPDRGDDAVGPAVAHRIAALGLPRLRVVEREDPTSLIDLFDGRDLVVVVDAVRSHGVPGSLTVIESGASGSPLPADAWVRAGHGGTHAFGLAAAVELARALCLLPAPVVLVGVEAAGLEHGEPLSAPVAAAVVPAAEVVLGMLWEAGTLPSIPDGGAPWDRSFRKGDR